MTAELGGVHPLYILYPKQVPSLTYLPRPGPAGAFQNLKDVLLRENVTFRLFTVTLEGKVPGYQGSSLTYEAERKREALGGCASITGDGFRFADFAVPSIFEFKRVLQLLMPVCQLVRRKSSPNLVSLITMLFVTVHCP